MKSWRFAFLLAVFGVLLIMQGYAAETESFTLYSPNYFNEANETFKTIHYLGDEYLSFRVCTGAEQSKVEAELTCSGSGNSTPLQVSAYSELEGCYFSNSNLNQLSCDTFDLDIIY